MSSCYSIKQTHTSLREPICHLPREIRQMIMKALSVSCEKKGQNRGVYATVNKEWQEFFEKENFALIILSQQRLSSFVNIVTGEKRRLVRHIWLRIELPTYDASLYVTAPRTERINSLFTDCVTKLFIALHPWTKPDDVHKNGLTLELSTHSATDSQVDMNRIFEHNPYSEPSDHFLRSDRPAEIEFARGIHQSIIVRQFMGQRNRLALVSRQEPPTESSPRLPSVNVVTEFVMRRQFYRQINTDGLRLLWESLTGLETIIYEPLAELITVVEDSNIYHDRGSSYEDLIAHSFPPTVKQLTIFEDWDIDIVRPLYLSELQPGEPLGRPVNFAALGLALFQASLQMEHLSLSSAVMDPKHFFAPFYPRRPNLQVDEAWRWNKLQTLAFRCHDLGVPQRSETINTLLHAISLAVRRMPKLQMMELWYDGYYDPFTFETCSPGPSIFRYEYDQGQRRAAITWQSAWSLPIEGVVLRSWRETARHIGALALHVRHEAISPAECQHLGLPPQLKLLGRILHPVSLEHVRLIEDGTWGF